MKTEKLEFIRVHLDDNYYCDVTPSADEPTLHDFTLHKIGDGDSTFMFALAIESEDQAVALAIANADQYKEV